MAKTISMSERQWAKLKAKIVEDHGQATVLISWRLRDALGFTVREYRDYSVDNRARCTIRLDFWDDHLNTMFLLKYSDYLSNTSNSDVI